MQRRERAGAACYVKSGSDMSWSQRPGSAAPPPDHAPYAPSPHPPQPQAYGSHQNMYANYPGAPPTSGNPQQQYWQAQQPLYNQQYGQQVYQQQDCGNNANQLFQQPAQYNQNYANQSFTNVQPQGYQQNYYPNQGAQHQNYQNKPNADSWEDNWDWGWEDSSKQAQHAVGQNVSGAAQVGGQPQQQQIYNNANVIEESFSNTDTWNWSAEDKKDSKQPTTQQQLEPSKTAPESIPLENNSVNEQSIHRRTSNSSAQLSAPEEVRSLSDREIVKERLPNLAVGKRLHLDNLTPQWSIESQMSQESSDGPQTHSEGTYRSDNQSRNSSKSSPGPNTDNSNFNYSQSGFEEWSHNSNEESTLVDNADSNSRRESHDELHASMQDMSITNREIPAPECHSKKELDSRKVPENMLPNLPPPSVSPANFPPPSSSAMPPPPPLCSSTAPPGPTTTLAGLPSPPTSSSFPPPVNFPPSSGSNPFKQNAQFSHKKVSSASPSLQTFPNPTSNSNLVSPAAVNKGSQHRVPVGFGANLETTPDNSERPDQPQMSPFRPKPIAPQVPDNLEVAPQNDRNEYLQTAHLSSGDYGDNTDFSRNVPPPGFRRMVVGQQESEYSQNINIPGDEPPPGLARMVPGQQTESDNSYNQSSDNYRERHIDGQPTESEGRPFRQADGQQNPNYSQPPPARATERRPFGLDRMVPGESSNNEYPQYQANNYGGSNEQRVVTGVDHDYPIPSDVGPSEMREQNVDGSDYSEQTPRSAPRGQPASTREVNTDIPAEFNVAPEEQQREIIMEGENLQDLSIISSAEMSYSREQTLEGADIHTIDTGVDRKIEASDSLEHPVTSSRRQSLNRVNTSGEESERDKAFKASPRRDRDKYKSSRDRDRDREREEGRYSRGDRKYDRESDRRSVRDDHRSEKDRRERERDRRDRDESPLSRRHRRSARSHRYETEDTDYYSDRERERRRYREGSYTSKPPRPEDKERRYEDRERSRRYNTIERDRHYGDRRGDRRDRYESRYRDIDPTRKHGNLRLEREEDERRRVKFLSDEKTNSCRKEGEAYSPRGASREAQATDEEAPEDERRERRERRRDRRDRERERDRDRDRADPYYDVYGSGVYGDPYALQRQQYQYYEHLRLTNPTAYMQVYKQLLAGRAPPPPSDFRPSKLPQNYADVYGSLGYEGRAEDRGSVHSGRSSANGLKGNDTFFGGLPLGAFRRDGSLRDAPSLRTDLSDRDLNTDASLNLHLEESTVRSERMTPFKFSTAHVKGSISSRHIVVVRPSYPVDGLPATVQILSLAAAAARDPLAAELHAFPGPLVKGVTHKKSVIDYCAAQARAAARAAPRDAVGYALVWELLALLLRQNGVVVGGDIAELLMKNARDHEHGLAGDASRGGSPRSPRSPPPPPPSGSRRGSAASGASAEAADARDEPGEPDEPDERTALARLRELLSYGNRQEALEWAASSGLWAHALALAALGERRARAAVLQRFLQAQPRRDVLHTLYAHLAAKLPPVVAARGDERFGDWRPHAAIMLANASAKPDQDRRTLMQLGDGLAARGLLFSAQFCYVAAGARPARHPLAPLQPGPPARAPPPLALLLADPRAASLRELAPDRAIFATEVYEYALSLNGDFALEELQVYKLVLATRLADAGLYERALAYVEAAARAVTPQPARYSPRLVAQLAELADRLKYHDPALHEDPPLLEDGAGDSGEPSPRHQQWLDDVKDLAQMLTAQAQTQAPAHGSPQHQSTPQHGFFAPAALAPQPADATYAWSDQTQQQYQPQTSQYEREEAADYSPYYGQHQHPQAPAEREQYGYEEWPAADAAPAADDAGAEPPPQPYGDGYWQGDSYYDEGGGGAGALGGEEARPTITMPGAPRGGGHAVFAGYADYDDDRPASAGAPERDAAPPKGATPAQRQDRSKDDGKGKGSGWLGGLFTKLSLRPPNQMILPDDKNPSIVWDEENKRWRNVDGSEDEAPQPPPPPPTLPHLAPLLAAASQSPPAAGAPSLPPPNASNIFKMQKSRHIKKSYVDVFNPSGAATRALPPAAEVLGPAAVGSAAPAYFVPHQVHVSVPPSPRASPPPSPAPSQESGIYDPALHERTDDDRYNTGI